MEERREKNEFLYIKEKEEAPYLPMFIMPDSRDKEPSDEWEEEVNYVPVFGMTTPDSDTDDQTSENELVEEEMPKRREEDSASSLPLVRFLTFARLCRSPESS